MTTQRRTAALLAPALILGVLAACSHSGTPPATAGSGVPASTAPAPSVPGPPSATPGTTVVRSTVAYQWHWPGDPAQPAAVDHTYPVPPLPRLVAIGAGRHPDDPGERQFERMSFTFTTAFPSYRLQFVDQLVGDGSGRTVPLPGRAVLKVTFRQAQAHDDGGAGTVATQPPAALGYPRMAGYAPGGDFEGVLTYGIGIAWPGSPPDPRIAVRVVEVEQVTAAGEHRYVVAVDLDATPLT